MKRSLVPAIAASLCLGLAACGSSGTGSQPASQEQAVGSTGPATTGAATAPTTAAKANGGASAGSGASSTAPSGSGGATPAPPASTQPAPVKNRYPHGDNSIQTFGHRGGEGDTSQIASAVEGYYAAIAHDDGARACSLMSAKIAGTIVQTLGRSPQLHSKGCAAILGLLFKRRSGASPAALADVHVTSVRIRGDRAFALLRGKLIRSGEIPMAREGGVWKVAALSGSELP
jgi:hypothetical protein